MCLRLVALAAPTSVNIMMPAVTTLYDRLLKLLGTLQEKHGFDQHTWIWITATHEVKTEIHQFLYSKPQYSLYNYNDNETYVFLFLKYVYQGT